NPDPGFSPWVTWISHPQCMHRHRSPRLMPIRHPWMEDRRNRSDIAGSPRRVPRDVKRFKPFGSFQAGYLTTSGFSSIEARPDLSKGRGIGWATPVASIVRLRKTYFPAASPGSRATQWAFV